MEAKSRADNCSTSNASNSCSSNALAGEVRSSSAVVARGGSTASKEGSIQSKSLKQRKALGPVIGQGFFKLKFAQKAEPFSPSSRKMKGQIFMALVVDFVKKEGETAVVL